MRGVTCRYLINYARAKPELIILAVNTFVRDTEDPNPLIRALALRTMACIRVQKIVEYLIIPLGKCIDDKDPYVRKTAAICVDKFYDMDPQRCEEEGFIDRLRHMIGDSSPMVRPSPLSDAGGRERGGVALRHLRDDRSGRAASASEAGLEAAGGAERVFGVGTDLPPGRAGVVRPRGRDGGDADRGEDDSASAAREQRGDVGVAVGDGCHVER